MKDQEKNIANTLANDAVAGESKVQMRSVELSAHASVPEASGHTHAHDQVSKVAKSTGKALNKKKTTADDDQNNNGDDHVVDNHTVDHVDSNQLALNETESVAATSGSKSTNVPVESASAAKKPGAEAASTGVGEIFDNFSGALPLIALLGGGAAIAAAAGGGSGGGGAAAVATGGTTAVANTTLHGAVILGSVVSGNDLEVWAYKADGSKLASAKVQNDGTYSLSYVASSYTGAVLLKVIDKAANNDAINDKTGVAGNLAANVYAVVSPSSGASTLANISEITTIAAIKLGITQAATLNATTGDSISAADSSAAAVSAVNKAIAAELAGDATGKQIIELTPKTTFTASGVAQTPDMYGAFLHDIVEIAINNGIPVADVMVKLAAYITVDKATSTVTFDPAFETLLFGGTVSENGTALANGLVSLAEANAGIAIKIALPTTAIAGDSAELRLAGATVGTPVVLTATDITNGYVIQTVVKADLGADASKSLTCVIKDATGFASVSSDALTFILDTVAPVAPAIDAVATDDVINLAESTATTISGTNESGATVNLTIAGVTEAATVSGTTWSYTLTPADVTALGQGVSSITATQTDAAGNVSSAGTHAVTVDTVAPTATVTAATIAVGGNAAVQSSETGTAYLVKDGINPTTVAGITGAAATDWSSVAISAANTSTSLTATGLAAGSYHVYTSDAAGNLSAASVDAVVIDATAPTVTGVVITGSAPVVSAGGVIHATVTMSEATTVTTTGGVPTYAIDVDGTTVQATYVSGSGTNTLVFDYTVAAGTQDLTGGITALADAFTLNGGSITDIVGNAANLSVAAIAAGTNTVQVDAMNPSVKNTAAIQAITNLDVTSDLVLDFGTAVTAAATGHIQLVNDANTADKAGYFGEATAHNFDFYFGAQSTVGGVTTIQAFSDAGLTTASGTVSISAAGVVTINPLYDLDLANNYHINVDANSFMASGLGNNVIDATTNLHFSTVTTGEALITGSLAASAASVIMGASGSMLAGHDWISVDVNNLGNSIALAALDLTGKDYALVLKNAATIAGDFYLGANAVNIELLNFTTNDMLYIDDQNNAGPVIFDDQNNGHSNAYSNPSGYGASAELLYQLPNAGGVYASNVAFQGTTTSDTYNAIGMAVVVA